MKSVEVTLLVQQDQEYLIQFVGGGPCTVNVGQTTTLDWTENARVVNVGTENDAIFDFYIPRGAPGVAGSNAETTCIPPVISTVSLPGGTIGVPYSQTLLTSSGTGSIVWSMVNVGGLPPGLSLDSETGEISGTPTGEADTASFIVIATNACGSPTLRLDLTINNPVGQYYAGEWPYSELVENGGLPLAFTEAYILTGLTDGDLGSPGRTGEIESLIFDGYVDFEFPETAQPTFRVMAFPTGFFSSFELPIGTPAGFNPADSTPYQTGLVINGVECEVFVLMEPDPGPFTVAGNNAVRAFI